MGILRRLREWREDKDGTLIGPNIDADSVDAGSLKAGEVDNVFHASNFDGADGGEKIQNALDKAASEPGTNRVDVGPVGPDNPTSAPESDVWRVSSYIDIEGYDNTELVGKGWPMLYTADGAEDDIIRSADDDSGTLTREFHIEGFRLHGNKSNNSTFAGSPSSTSSDKLKGLVGIRLIKCENCTVDRIYGQNFTRYVYQVTKSHHMVARNIWAENCDDDGITAMNQFYQDQDLSDITIERFVAINNGDQGVEIEDGATDVTVRKGHLSGNANNGASIKAHYNNNNSSDPPNDEEPPLNVTFEEVTFENNGAGLRLKGSVLSVGSGHTITNCEFSEPDGWAIDIGASGGSRLGFDDVTIEDCRLEQGAGLRTTGGEKLTGFSIDVTCRNGAGVRLASNPIDGLSLSADVDGAGGEGIRVAGDGGVVRDLTIEADTIVKNSDAAGLRFFPAGGQIKDVECGGTYKNNGQDGALADDERVGVQMDLQGGSPPDIKNITLSQVRAYDDQGTKTQQYGIRDNGQQIRIDGCNVEGNAQSGYFDQSGYVLYDGRAFNSGDPNSAGVWNNVATRDFAERYNATVIDTSNNVAYIRRQGSWVAIDTQ